MSNINNERQKSSDVTLWIVISQILDKNISENVRCLRTFQLLYWIAHGGSDAQSFKYSSTIFASALLGERSWQRDRRALRRSDAALLSISDRIIAQILDEVNNNSLFYQLLKADKRMLHPSSASAMLADLRLVHASCHVYLKVHQSGKVRNTFNDVAKITKGRTLQTKLRHIYRRQRSFVYALVAENIDLIRLFDTDQKRLVTSIQLLNGLQRLVESGDMRNLLARAKAACTVIDQDLAEEVSTAWECLEAANMHLEPLSEEETALLTKHPRRSAADTKKTKRRKSVA